MGMRAVIADDEVLIRMYIREILENNGYEIAGEAEDGMDAVTVCREQRPDFVIMDINMPVMTGLEAARKKNDEVKEFSRTITGQIRSMSVTYDLLTHTDTELADVGQMLSRIIDGVLGGYASGDSRIETEIRGDRLMFPELAASTVALIVNELVTNSMKYAFHGRDHGKIELTMESGEEFAWFTVEDDGCGMEKSGGERGRGGSALPETMSIGTN